LPETAPPVHLRLRGILDEATERLALRAALSASHLMGLARARICESYAPRTIR
jgi:hypothetical protein